MVSLIKEKKLTSIHTWPVTQMFNLVKYKVGYESFKNEMHYS